MQAIQAKFTDGVFIPVEPVQLPEGFRVTLWIDPLTIKVETEQQQLSYLEDLAENRGEVLRRMAE